jgi:hypothetical protein
MTLKGQMAADLENDAVWFNGDDFADWHEVNGKRMLCELGAARSRPEKIGRMIGGAYAGSSYLFARAAEFQRAPRPDEPIEIDGVRFRITSVMNDCGVYVIEYRRYEDGKLRRPGA